jgi:hypothetical protein
MASPTPGGGLDSDGDGCSNQEELGPNPQAGGQRDPFNPWDFYDLDGDSLVGLSDLVTLIGAFGTHSGDAAYHPNYDRALSGPDPWDLKSGDGVVSATDLSLIVAQYGHSCTAPP